MKRGISNETHYSYFGKSYQHLRGRTGRENGKIVRKLQRQSCVEEQGKLMDKKVVPMVRFFNSIGLKTHMSCSGHFNLDGRMALFWIEFDSLVTEEALVELWNTDYKPNGWFVQRLIPGPRYNLHRWCYVAGNWWSAKQDLKNWKKVFKI